MEGMSEDIWRRRKLDDHTDVEYKSSGKEILLGHLTDQSISPLWLVVFYSHVIWTDSDSR